MIKYSLVCDEAHEFVGWFRSSEDYETQAKRGFVECPTCQSTRVDKAVMAPNVARRDRVRNGPASDESAQQETARENASPQEAPAGPPMALMDDKPAEIRAMMRELRAKILENSTDVGDKFAEQARRMHDGEIPQKSIRGQTSLDEARSLWEDGVPVLPIPVLPDDHN